MEEDDEIEVTKKIVCNRRFCFTCLKQNYDIPTGSFRPIRLDLPPFSFPEPLRIINEKCPDPGFDDKALALYRIRILP